MTSGPDASDAPSSLRLYHYTSAAGLLGIIECRCLFASDIWFLNDAAEVRYAQGRMLARLSERDDQDPDGGWLRELLVASASGDGLDSRFVASFCEEPDLLSQWRGYATGGFAIGFASAGLAALDTVGDGARLVKVDYGPDEARPRLRPLFEEVAAGGPYPPDERERIARRVLGPELARVKDPSFSEEREWRLLVTDAPPERVLFRPGPAGLVPYVEIPLPDPSPVCEIVIGPGGERPTRRRGVEQLLALRGYSAVAVRESSSSLRW